MIEGREGVERKIAQQKEEREIVVEQISKLREQYQDLEEIERYYGQKCEEFQQIMERKRKNAQRIAECVHPPYGVKELAVCLTEKLYGSSYEIAAENVREFGERIFREKEQVLSEIEQKETEEQMVKQKISSLEKLLLTGG